VDAGEVNQYAIAREAAGFERGREIGYATGRAESIAGAAYVASSVGFISGVLVGLLCTFGLMLYTFMLIFGGKCGL
jgi:hypothetical protein